MASSWYILPLAGIKWKAKTNLADDTPSTSPVLQNTWKTLNTGLSFALAHLNPLVSLLPLFHLLPLLGGSSLFCSTWGKNYINPLKGLACSPMAINCTPPQPIIITFGKLNTPEKSVCQIFMFTTIFFITRGSSQSATFYSLVTGKFCIMK